MRNLQALIGLMWFPCLLLLVSACTVEFKFGGESKPKEPVKFTGLAAIQIPDTYIECLNKPQIIRQFLYSIDTNPDEWHKDKDILHRNDGGAVRPTTKPMFQLGPTLRNMFDLYDEEASACMYSAYQRWLINPNRYWGEKK